MEDRIFGPHHIQQVWKTIDHLFQYLKETNNWSEGSEYSHSCRAKMGEIQPSNQKWKKGKLIPFVTVLSIINNMALY
jgi:hypothetical protein